MPSVSRSLFKRLARPLGGALLRQIAEESERVRYAKVENAPPAQKVYEAIQHGGDLVTVFGGASGSYLIEELRRGSQGTMPWPSRPQPFVSGLGPLAVR